MFYLIFPGWGDHFRFGYFRTKTGSNRFGSVFPVLARFWLGFSGLARFFFRFFVGSVRFFRFFAYKTETEPNRTGWFFQKFNRFNRVFFRFGFFDYFFFGFLGLIGFPVFLLTPSPCQYLQALCDFVY